jgi:hypothetical protein
VFSTVAEGEKGVCQNMAHFTTSKTRVEDKRRKECYCIHVLYHSEPVGHGSDNRGMLSSPTITNAVPVRPSTDHIGAPFNLQYIRDCSKLFTTSVALQLNPPRLNRAFAVKDLKWLTILWISNIFGTKSEICAMKNHISDSRMTDLLGAIKKDSRTNLRIKFGLNQGPTK